jgi:hypothetical protein
MFRCRNRPGARPSSGDPTAVPAAYDTPNGEGVTDTQQTMLAVNAAFVEAIRRGEVCWLAGNGLDANGRARNLPQLGPGSRRAWAQGLGRSGSLDRDPSSGASSLPMNSWSPVAGLEYQAAANLFVGAAPTYSVEDRQTTGNIPGGETGLWALGRSDDSYTNAH